jgi:hypothetical protein
MAPLNLEKLKRYLDSFDALPEEEKARRRKEMEEDTKCKWLEWERDRDADETERKVISRAISLSEE